MREISILYVNDGIMVGDILVMYDVQLLNSLQKRGGVESSGKSPHPMSYPQHDGDMLQIAK